MGVDASYYVLYGIEWEGPQLVECWSDDAPPLKYYTVEDEESDYYEQTIIEYNYKWFDEHNIEIVYEPYGLNWTIIGIRFLSNKVQETIDNLSKVESEWQLVVKTFEEAGYKDKLPEPSIISDAYLS